jgi:CRISPR-associated endonuclease/helicase Cas3
MLEHPPFEVFFSALHRGQRPLPWQQRLASQVSWDGWPVVPIGVPTGLGKTACLDIAVWALAGQAGRRPAERTLPTRTWYVVNRRLLVDAAHAHGDKMKRLLTSPVLVGKEGPEQEWEASPEHVLALQLMRASLKSLGALNLEEPLGTVRLRGGAELGARPPDPSQPCLVFATVPMFASRWLFRGYGTSTSMRPVDAALAGIDTLVLLDEAHLAAPLALLADPLAECDPGDPTLVLPLGRCRPTFVSLTATSGEGERFDLTAQDYEHPIVRDRMGAAKPTTLVETTAKDLSKELAGQAVALLEESSRRTCLVFVNTAARARDVHTRLVGAGREVLLVTGRARDWEADALRARLLDPHCGVAAGREEGSSEPPLWIVATQTLEVGADIDVDALVTQSAGVRALVQRFGRLNRFGHRPRAAAAICHAFDLEDLVYGDEPLVAWERLCDAGSGVSLSPEAIGSILGEPADKLDRGCEPLPGLVWEWAKTSLRSWGEAPPEAYFSNLNEDVARVSVCWRAYRPPDGIRLIPSVAAAESIELPIGELRRALQDRGELTLRRLSDDKATLESAALGELRPGDVVIVDAAQGLYDEFGWNPSETRLVPDVSLFEARILPLKKEAIENLVAPDDVTLLLDLLKELDAAGGYEGAIVKSCG